MVFSARSRANRLRLVAVAATREDRGRPFPGRPRVAGEPGRETRGGHRRGARRRPNQRVSAGERPRIGLRWRRRPRRRGCRSDLPGQWGFASASGWDACRRFSTLAGIPTTRVTDHDTETADAYQHLLTTRLERRPGRAVLAATCRPGGHSRIAAELAGPIRMLGRPRPLIHGVRVASVAATAVPGRRVRRPAGRRRRARRDFGRPGRAAGAVAVVARANPSTPPDGAAAAWR